MQNRGAFFIPFNMKHKGELKMGKILRQAVANRRLELINKLIAFGVYKKDEVHLFELSLTDLENEFRNFIRDQHPHSEIDSLHWINKN
jgi:hypothetical protein